MNQSNGAEQRCSGLDLLSCVLGLDYASQGFRMGILFSSVLLDNYGMAFAPRHRGQLTHTDLESHSSSIAPPLRTPARVIPGRTLLEVKVGLVPTPPLNFKIDPRGQYG